MYLCLYFIAYFLKDLQLCSKSIENMKILIVASKLDLESSNYRYIHISKELD